MVASMRWAVIVAALALGLGCGGQEEGGGAPAAPAAAEAPEAPAAPETAPAPAPAAPAAGAGAAAEAKQIFDTRCVTCHGPRGAGDGPGSAALDPKPRNFQDASWQDSVTDEHLERIILYGGAAVGKSPAMPGNPDLQAKPEVTRALVQYIRELGAD